MAVRLSSRTLGTRQGSLASVSGPGLDDSGQYELVGERRIGTGWHSFREVNWAKVESGDYIWEEEDGVGRQERLWGEHAQTSISAAAT